MLGDHRFAILVDFPQLYDVFPGVKIRGGVSYWLWGREHDGGCDEIQDLVHVARRRVFLGQQLHDVDERLEDTGFSRIRCMEIWTRGIRIKKTLTRPHDRMIGHTGYLLFARKLEMIRELGEPPEAAEE